MGEVALGVIPVGGEAHGEGAAEVQQFGDRGAVQRLRRAPAEQTVVGVDGQAGARVVHARLAHEEVQVAKLVLDQLHERAGRAEADVGVERGVLAPFEEAEHQLVAVVRDLDGDRAHARADNPLGKRAVGVVAVRLKSQPVGLDQLAAEIGADGDPLAGDERADNAGDVHGAAGDRDRVTTDPERVGQRERDACIDRLRLWLRRRRGRGGCGGRRRCGGHRAGGGRKSA